MLCLAVTGDSRYEAYLRIKTLKICLPLFPVDETLIIQNADNSISDAKNSLNSIPSQLANPSAEEKIEETLQPACVAESGIENPTELDAVETPIDDQSKDAAPKLSGSST